MCVCVCVCVCVCGSVEVCLCVEAGRDDTVAEWAGRDHVQWPSGQVGIMMYSGRVGRSGSHTLSVSRADCQ